MIVMTVGSNDTSVLFFGFKKVPLPALAYSPSVIDPHLLSQYEVTYQFSK